MPAVVRSVDRFRWILWRVVAGGFAAHAVFALVFAALGMPVAAGVTALGLVMPALAFELVRRGHTQTAFAAICLDITIFAVAGTILGGETSGFLFYVMVPLVLAALHPNRSTLHRWAWAAVLASTYGAFELLWPWHLGLAGWDPGAIHVLHVFNVLIVSGAMVATALLSAFAVTRAEGALTTALRDMERLAMRDALTALPNRRATEEALAREAGRCRRSGHAYSVLMGDIDCFKDINDRYGHAFGDEVLRSVAATLRSCVRDHDLVGRWGGEEFLLILPDTGPAEAAHVAEKLRRAVERQETGHEGHATKVTITLGIAGSEEGSTPETLIEVADSAMYRGKAAGRNRVVVAGFGQDGGVPA